MFKSEYCEVDYLNKYNTDINSFIFEIMRRFFIVIRSYSVFDKIKRLFCKLICFSFHFAILYKFKLLC